MSTEVGAISTNPCPKQLKIEDIKFNELKNIALSADKDGNGIITQEEAVLFDNLLKQNEEKNATFADYRQLMGTYFGQNSSDNNNVADKSITNDKNAAQNIDINEILKKEPKDMTINDKKVLMQEIEKKRKQIEVLVGKIEFIRIIPGLGGAILGGTAAGIYGHIAAVMDIFPPISVGLLIGSLIGLIYGCHLTSKLSKQLTPLIKEKDFLDDKLAAIEDYENSGAIKEDNNSQE